MRYPRSFLVVNEKFDQAVADQLIEMAEGKSGIYVPGVSRKISTIDNEIAAIKIVDQEIKKRHNTRVIAFSKKVFNDFFYMRISDFEPCIYWLDSKSDSENVQIGVESFADLESMRTFLSVAGEAYATVVKRHQYLSAEKIFVDESVEKIFSNLRWGNISNAEAAVRVWMKSQLKVGILNRLDL